MTAGCTATVSAAATPAKRLRPMPWLLAAGLPFGLARARTHLGAQRASYPEWTPRQQNPGVAVAAGTIAGLALAHGPKYAAAGTRWSGHALARRTGGSPSKWSLAVAAGAAAGVGLLGLAGAKFGLGKLSEIGTRPDPALLVPPDNSNVSGGPASTIDYGTLARDGRRFVSLVTPAQQIEMVQPQAMEPVRVYCGIASAQTPEERVDLAMADLERLGAFDRSTLLIMCPSGSGYADYVAAEAIECFTAGDCASIVMQYGVLPSMLSLSRVDLGARTTRELLDRIEQRLATATHRPRILMYGESLGAKVAQEALEISPSRVSDDASVTGLDTLISVGTPGGPSMRQRFLHSPNVVHLDRWQQLTGDEAAQLWFIDHDADPVTRWDGRLAVRFPYWLRQPRGRNIPEDMNWLPALTWWQVVFDLVYAAQQQSGVFRSIGHDYRADLAPILAQVTGSSADVTAVSKLLAEREVERDRITSA